jgi:hypothetical protein
MEGEPMSATEWQIRMLDQKHGRAMDRKAELKEFGMNAVLAAARTSGFHGDRRNLTRLVTAHRDKFSGLAEARSVLQAAYDSAELDRKAGIRCPCVDCKRLVGPFSIALVIPSYFEESK